MARARNAAPQRDDNHVLTDEEEAIKAQARALKRSGFMDTTPAPEDAEQEPVAA